MTVRCSVCIICFSLFSRLKLKGFLDGTSDVTRTFHFGTPSKEMKNDYTRLLSGKDFSFHYSRKKNKNFNPNFLCGRFDQIFVGNFPQVG